MNKQRVAEISYKSGKSASTVSKVLRNCPGVDPETRAAVRSALGTDEASGLIRSRDREGARICVILPDNPKYFWHRALSVLDWRKERVITKIYSDLRREESDREVAICLDEAIAEKVSAIILAARPGQALQERLACMAKDMLILQLCEYTPVVNSFYVGSDPYGDGVALAAAVKEKETGRPVVGVIRREGDCSYEPRTQGFLDALGGRADVFFVDQPEYTSLYASHLARAIDGLGVRLDYLFCCSGLTAGTCDAIYKLKGKMKTQYIGFELPPVAKKHWDGGRIAALAVQKPEEQLRVALALAEHYVREHRFPDEKMHYLPSSYFSFKKEK